MPRKNELKEKKQSLNINRMTNIMQTLSLSLLQLFPIKSYTAN